MTCSLENERRITETWFIPFEKVFDPKSARPQFPPLLHTFIVRPTRSLARISAGACLPNIITAVREQQTFSPKSRLNFQTICPQKQQAGLQKQNEVQRAELNVGQKDVDFTLEDVDEMPSSQGRI